MSKEFKPQTPITPDPRVPRPLLPAPTPLPHTTQPKKNPPMPSSVEIRINLWYPGAFDKIGSEQGDKTGIRHFLSSPASLFKPHFDQNFCAACKFLKKQAKKSFWCTFWIKNCVFSGRARPSKLLYIGAQGPFRNILRSVSQKCISQNSTKGTLWVGRGSNSRREKASAPPPP